MFAKNILLFGYGNHGKFIAQGLAKDGFSVKVVESNEEYYRQAQEDGFQDAVHMDVTKDDALKALNPQDYVKLVCVMDDEHLNVFLTLSLHSLFNESYILSISDSMHTTKKLKMAGATKVIDLYEVSANKIHNILKRPVATKLLEGFVLERDGIGFKEMIITEDSFLVGMTTDEIDFSPYGVLLVGMIDEELGHAFVFITAGINHNLDCDDTIVCIGPRDKLEAFSEEIKKRERSI
ncbi:MAG TPA: TrkA family potassium uptake protein [Epsilonproteobacteria bacterium]|nr:TrkA family potassium uptake protein [Campylobacterota bacterium]